MSGYEQLITKAMGGDSAAFEEIYRRINKKVYFTCISFLKNEHDAADVSQEVYITILKNLSTLKDASGFEGWVSRVTVNKCKDFLKKNKPVPIEEETLSSMIDGGEQELLLPEDYVVNEAKRKILMDILRESLSDTLYQTVVLFYFHDMSAAEIASMMDCPVGTVTSRLCIARAKIKKGVQNYEEKNGDKLYSTALIPILAAILTVEANAMEPVGVWADVALATSQAKNTAQGATTSGGTSGGASSGGSATQTTVRGGISGVSKTAGGRAMLHTLKGKILAGIIAAMVVTAGIIVAIMISNNAKDEPSGEKSSPTKPITTTTTPDNIEDEGTVTTKPTTPTATPTAAEDEEKPTVDGAPEAIHYKMAEIHKKTYKDSKYNITELWLAVELADAEWLTVYGEEPFEITYNKTGESISELGDINHLMNDELFIDLSLISMGNLCQYTHMRNEEVPEEYESLSFPSDRYVMTLCIYSNRDINFDDFSIDLSMNHYPTNTDITTSLEYNADILEITTSPDVIHAGNLFEIDGNYYVVYLEGMNRTNFDYDDNLDDEDEPARVYRYFEVKCINVDSVQMLADAFDGHIQLVYGSESGMYLDAEIENPNYLKPIDLGEGYEIFVEVIDEEDGTIAIGFEAKDGYTFEENSDTYNAIATSLPLYTSDDGEEILFALNFVS